MQDAHHAYCDQNHTQRQQCNDTLSAAVTQPVAPTRAEPAQAPRTRFDRLAALKRDGILTDAEYEAKRVALIDEAIGGIPNHSSATSRNIGHVLLGALGGFWLGLVFIGALLAFSPREKRADRLFGAWFGTAASGLLMTLVVTAISMSPSSGATASSSRRSYQPSTNVAGASVPYTPAPMTRTAVEVVNAVATFYKDEPCQLTLVRGVWTNRLDITYRADQYSPRQLTSGDWHLQCSLTSTGTNIKGEPYAWTGYSCYSIKAATLEVTGDFGGAAIIKSCTERLGGEW